jgi:hypothetical protein
MSCAHCERKVEAAALAIDGVESVIADTGGFAMAIKAGAVLVVFLGITTLSRAWALSDMVAPWDGPQMRYAATNAYCVALWQLYLTVFIRYCSIYPRGVYNDHQNHSHQRHDLRILCQGQ